MDQGIMTHSDVPSFDASTLIADQPIRQASLDFALGLRALVPMHEDAEDVG